MDFAYTSEQEGIRQSIQSLMKDFPDEYWMARDQAHEFPMDFHDAIAKAGYLGLVIP